MSDDTTTGAGQEGAWPHGAPCWVDCQVDDVARAGGFYSGLLGWELRDHRPGSGYVLGALGGRLAAGIGPKPMGGGVPSVWHTYFAVDDVDEAAERVASIGGTVVMMPFDTGSSGRMAMAADPTGATFGLWTGRDLQGAEVAYEPGAYCWSELRSPDPSRARGFYAWLFDWTFLDVGSAYSLFIPRDGGAPVGGIAPQPSADPRARGHWLVWFRVVDAAASLDAVERLGGAAPPEAGESPMGRTALVAGACGEVFGVIQPRGAGAG